MDETFQFVTRHGYVLRRRGITRVRPLAGGLAGWRDRGFPMVPYQPLGARDPLPVAR